MFWEHLRTAAYIIMLGVISSLLGAAIWNYAANDSFNSFIAFFKDWEAIYYVFWSVVAFPFFAYGILAWRQVFGKKTDSDLNAVLGVDNILTAEGVIGPSKIEPEKNAGNFGVTITSLMMRTQIQVSQDKNTLTTDTKRRRVMPNLVNEGAEKPDTNFIAVAFSFNKRVLGEFECEVLDLTTGRALQIVETRHAQGYGLTFICIANHPANRIKAKLRVNI